MVWTTLAFEIGLFDLARLDNIVVVPVGRCWFNDHYGFLFLSFLSVSVLCYYTRCWDT